MHTNKPLRVVEAVGDEHVSDRHRHERQRNHIGTYCKACEPTTACVDCCNEGTEGEHTAIVEDLTVVLPPHRPGRFLFEVGGTEFWVYSHTGHEFFSFHSVLF